MGSAIEQSKEVVLPGMEEESVDPLADLEERRVLFGAIDSFRLYRSAGHYNITHMRRQGFYALPAQQIELLSSPPFNLPATFAAVDDAIDANADIADAILSSTLDMYGLTSEDYSSWRDAATPNDMDKARSTIRQIYRDWTVEGADERKASYGPMLAALDHAFRDIPVEQRYQIKVLNPGAGLGRLAFEVCNAGYTVEGNEISYHQLMASNWFLNGIQSASQHPFYPWALNFSNRVTRAHQLQKLAIPDICPLQEMQVTNTKLSPEHTSMQRMSMSAGDFCVTYKSPSRKDEFNAVLTCFFIDTAPNLISYVEAVRNCLAAGGVWINLGPLLWHFDGKGHQQQEQQGDAGPASASAAAAAGEPEEKYGDLGIAEAGSFELSDEEVLQLVQAHGFEVTHSEILHNGAGYIQDPNSMLHNMYRPSFWVAKKLD